MAFPRLRIYCSSVAAEGLGMRSPVVANLRTALFGISPVEARLDRRGFAATTPDKQNCLESVESPLSTVI